MGDDRDKATNHTLMDVTKEKHTGN